MGARVMRFLASSAPTAAATPKALAADMDAEIAKGRKLYEDGIVLEAYMSPDYAQAFLLLDAPDAAAAEAILGEYPQVREGLITFAVQPLVGLPAVEQSHEQAGTPLPAWWPQA